MERMSKDYFDSLKPYNDINNNIKYFNSKYLIKSCKKNSLEFLEFIVSLRGYNLPNLLFPSEIFEIVDDDKIKYAILVKNLKRYDSLISLKYKKYTTKEILKLYQSILLTLKTIHELGLIQLDVANRNILVNNKNYYLFDWDTSLIFANDRLISFNPRIKEYTIKYSKQKVDLLSENYYLKDLFCNDDIALTMYNLLRTLNAQDFKNIGPDDRISSKYVIKTLKELNLPFEIYEILYNYYILNEVSLGSDYFKNLLDYLIENDYKKVLKK